MTTPFILSIIGLLAIGAIEYTLGNHANHRALMHHIARAALYMCVGLLVAGVGVIAVAFDEQVIKLLAIAALPPILTFVGLMSLGERIGETT